MRPNLKKFFNWSDKTSRKFTHYTIALLLSLLLGAIIVIILLVSSDISWETMWLAAFDNLVSSILGAFLGVLFLNIFLQWHTEKIHDEEVAENLVEVLTKDPEGDSVPLLYRLFKKESRKDFMQRTIKSYCASQLLSDYYLDYIHNTHAIVKQDEDYQVFVSKRNGQLEIEQSLTDTRIFLSPNRADTKIYIYLIFNCDTHKNKSGLDKKLADTKYFLREELTDNTIVNKIKEWYKNQETSQIIGEDGLNMRITIFDDKNQGYTPSDISYQIDDTGLEITIAVPDKYIYNNREIFFGEENAIQYTAKVQFKYTLPQSKTNVFYAIYSVPTIGPTSFQMHFTDMSEQLNDIERMRLISFANGQQRLKPDDGELVIKGNTISFHTDRAIFPRSGLVFAWRNNNSNNNE